MASLVEKIDIAVCRYSASDVSQRLALRKMQPFADVTLMGSDLGEMFQGWPSRRPSHIARAGMTRRFHCDRCGACCLQLSCFGDLYVFLDDGSGVCRHYDRKKGPAPSMRSVRSCAGWRTDTGPGLLIFLMNVTCEECGRAVVNSGGVCARPGGGKGEIRVNRYEACCRSRPFMKKRCPG